MFFITSEPYIGITLERNERGRDETRHGRSKGKKGGTKRAEEGGTKRAEEGGSGEGGSNRANRGAREE